MRQYLTYSDGASNKFWAVQVAGTNVTVVYGKIGTGGQSSTKTYASEEEATKQAEKQAASKLKKGYAPGDAPDGFVWPGEGAVPKAAENPAQKAKKKPAGKAAEPPANGPEPKEDTGKIQPWHQDEYFDGWGYELEWFEDLSAPFAEDKAPPAKPPQEPKVAESPAPAAPTVPPEEAAYYYWNKGTYTPKDAPAQGEDQPPEPGRNHQEALDENLAFAALEDRGEFGQACGGGRLRRVERCLALMEERGWDQEDVQRYLDTGVNYILTFGSVDPDAIPVLQLLLQRGASFKQVQNYDLWFVDRYTQENKTPADIPAMFQERYDTVFEEILPQFVEVVRSILTYMHGGEKAEWINQYAPESWPAGCTAMTLKLSEGTLKVHGGRKQLASKRLSGADGFTRAIANPYLVERLPAELEKLVAEGLFDGLSEPVISVYLKDVDKPVFIYRGEAAAQRREEMEAFVARLETAEDLHAASKGKQLDKAVEELLQGVYLEVDVPRAAALLRKYLYSCETEPMEAAEYLLKKYRTEAPQLQYEFALWRQANYDYIDAWSNMEEAAQSGYAPAEEKLVEFYQLAHERALKKPKPEQAQAQEKKPGQGPRQKMAGYIPDEEKRRIMATRFTNEDLFTETENIIARASQHGQIYLRFKVEGEAGYSEALDFLNHLLEKEYNRIWGGYALFVRFVHKPVFIKELAKTFPNTSCHAFFARAVQYPALRAKVEQYAHLALVEFTWYTDLEGDRDNTLPGTFAACALAFCDESYIHMAGEYARTSDDEHQHIQLELAPALLKKYGATPAVAKAVFDVCASNGQAGEVVTKKELYTDAANLAAVMEHGDACYSEQRLEWNVPAYVEALMGDDAKANLRKLKTLSNKSTDEQARETYVNFYNFYKDYAEKQDDADYGDYLGTTVEENQDLRLPVYNEPLPPVVKLADEPELEARVTEGDEYWAGHKKCFFLTPSAIATREEDEYVRGQLEAMDKNNDLDYYPSVEWVRGSACFRAGKWLVDTSRLAKSYALVLYDGKNKPWLLYGLYNAVPLYVRYYERPYKAEWQVETARREYMVAEAPETVAVSEEMDACFKTIQRSIVFGYWYMVDKLTARFTPEDGPLYSAALLARRQLAIAAEDDEQLARLEEQLAHA